MGYYEDNIDTFKNNMLAKVSVSQDVCVTLKDKIVGMEQHILKLGPSNYRETPENTITTRHQYYNLLDYLNNDLEPVKVVMKEQCSKILGGEKFLVKMWANIFRNNECIKFHTHHSRNVVDDIFKKNVFKTLCGNLFLYGDADSDTIYYFDEKTPVKNVVGDIHMFSCITPHETLPFQGNLRVGLAFDVYTENFFTDMGLVTPPNLRLI